RSARKPWSHRRCRRSGTRGRRSLLPRFSVEFSTYTSKVASSLLHVKLEIDEGRPRRVLPGPRPESPSRSRTPRTGRRWSPIRGGIRPARRSRLGPAPTRTRLRPGIALRGRRQCSRGNVPTTCAGAPRAYLTWGKRRSLLVPPRVKEKPPAEAGGSSSGFGQDSMLLFEEQPHRALVGQNPPALIGPVWRDTPGHLPPERQRVEPLPGFLGGPLGLQPAQHWRPPNVVQVDNHAPLEV